MSNILSVDFADYSDLFSYALLAGASINAAPNAQYYYVDNGNWGCFAGPSYITTVGPTGTSPGQIDQTTTMASAFLDLNDLQTYITNGITGNVYNVLSIGTSGATFINDGNINIWYSPTAISITGAPMALTFDGNGDSNAQFFIVAPSIILNNVYSVLTNGAQSQNIFYCTTIGSTGNMSFSNSSYGTLMLDGNIIATSNIVTGGVLNYTGCLFSIEGDISTDTISTNVTGFGDIPCYCRGTKILTKNGYKVVERLKCGDEIATKGVISDNEEYVRAPIKYEKIMWISKFSARNLTYKSWPICIKASALAPNSPNEDLFVSPGHALIVNGQIIRAKKLLNGDTIYQDKSRHRVTYYHIETEKHSVLVANNVLAESYIDVDNRDKFLFKERAQKKQVEPAAHDLMVHKSVTQTESIAPIAPINPTTRRISKMSFPLRENLNKIKLGHT